MLWLGVVILLAANWPQWRGPESSGVSSEKNLPLEWSATRNIAWKTPVPGQGRSSPIVWGNRIFLTSAVEGDVLPGAKAPKHVMDGNDFVHPDSVGATKSHKLLVICLERDSGKILWERTAYEGAVYDDRHKKGSYASPTPVTDGRAVYAFFGSQGLYAYDFDGKLLWKMSPGNLGSFGMGPGTSPALDGDLLFLQCDSEDGSGSFVAALDRRTGRQVWKAERKTRVSWATPVVIQAAGRKELIASGSETIVSYDPATGKELWRAGGVAGHAIPSTVHGHGMVFVSAGYPEKRAFGIKLGQAGEVVWSYQKGTAYVPSPILYGDYLYLMTDRGLLTCLEAKTGQVKYEGARVPVPATFTASPVAFEGKILLTSEDGDTFVLKAGPVHEVLRTNPLGEPVYSSPAISDGRIYLRGDRHLYAIQP
ncbi:MAG: PQQ-binding-like beta-propeller repeat protein [Acidobacteria bacterium]|nr:PQQ-binding-like beta-propeller repeat protein [Acidobacteriota bacterium]MBI3470853.1 PQQ-binding-like beta-propeller repeat protein [Candidatus Solibacter usitatus]